MKLLAESLLLLGDSAAAATICHEAMVDEVGDWLEVGGYIQYLRYTV